jgi:hypothetical protein
MSDEKPRPYEPKQRNPIGGGSNGIPSYKHGAVDSVFPKVCIIRTGNTISITTTVRKKADDGKWYKNIVFSVFNAKPPHPLSDADVHALIENFNRDLYHYILFGRAGKLNTPNGEKFSGIDEDQRSEEERLGIQITPPSDKLPEAQDGDDELPVNLP